MSEWQPIDTAPTDLNIYDGDFIFGKEILLLVGNQAYQGRYTMYIEEDHMYWTFGDDIDEAWVDPTHWCELPKHKEYEQ